MIIHICDHKKNYILIYILRYIFIYYILGTTVQIRNLFNQVPVRRQIITNTRKANQTIKLLETLMQCFGICKPNVRIQFRVNNNVTFTKPSLNNIKEAVNHILGRRIMSNMEWLESKDAEVRYILEII